MFFQIVEKTIPAQLEYENERVIAFRDINPQAPHHLLIIPKRHIPTIADISSEDLPLLGEMVSVANQLAKDLGVKDSGYRLVINCGKSSGQAIFHLHLHLLGGRKMSWPPG
ncbi:MAG: histidine triad nucleotide-binding protein [bacterium]